MEKERILYPSYFNKTLMRKEGRRVAKSLAVKNPSCGDLEKALKKSGISYRIEEKQNPAHWWRKEGRVVVQWDGSKERLLRCVSAKLEAKK